MNKRTKEAEARSVLIEEVWRPVKDFPNYQVSNMGNIKSRGKRVLKPEVSDTGYLLVCLSKSASRNKRYIHRLVAEAFIPNPNNKPQVNHKNSIRSDNKSHNLEWASCSENIRHGYKYGHIKAHAPLKGKTGKNSSLSRRIAQMDMDGTVVKLWDSANDAKRHFNIKNSNISLAANGVRKSCRGFKWKYTNI